MEEEIEEMALELLKDLYNYLSAEFGENEAEALDMIEEPLKKAKKSQIAPLNWAYYSHKHNPPMGMDSWFADCAMGQLSIVFNNGCYVLRVNSENGSGIVGGFGSLEEAKADAQERHNNAVMQFFVPS